MYDQQSGGGSSNNKTSFSSPNQEGGSWREKIKKKINFPIAILIIILLSGVMAFWIVRHDNQTIKMELNNEADAAKNKKDQSKLAKVEKTNNIIVRMKNPRTVKSATEGVKLAEEVAAEKDTSVKAVSKVPGHAEISLIRVEDKTKIDEVINELKKNPDVLSVEQDMIVSIPDPQKDGEKSVTASGVAGTPNDPNLTWGYQNIKANETEAEPDNEPMVAVIDTGVDYTHPELAGRVVLGHDFANNDEDPMDDHGHGTHVSGIIAASANNGIGSAGVSSRARLLALKALNGDGFGSMYDVIQALYVAADNAEVRVINMSLGGTYGALAYHNAVNYAVEKRKLLVAAAGNSNVNYWFFPAFWSQISPGVIAVAANDQNGCKASFSNFGFWVSVSAPGVGIMSTLPSNNYGSWSGTSMATPFVSGAAARLLAKNANLQPNEIRSIIMNNEDVNLFDNSCWPKDSAIHPFEGQTSSFGHLNLANALVNIPGVSDDKENPKINITSPADGYTANQSIVDISGTASDNDAVSRVTWTNDRGGEGIATGTANWQAKAVPLFSGVNNITVTALDRSSNRGKKTIKITYLPSNLLVAESSVAASSDDAVEVSSSGSVNLTSVKSYIGKGNVNGFHFANISVPKNAIIATAVLSFQSVGYEKSSISLNYYGEATDNASTFAQDKKNISSRTKTLARIADVPSAWTKDEYNQSADLRDIIQEIVNRDGWNSGNAINIMAVDNISKLYRLISTYDKNPSASPKLKIYYSITPPSTPSDNVAPSVSISSPALPAGSSKYNIDQQEIGISGTSSDNVGVTKVSYDSDNGASGDAVGTESWVIEKIKLKEGDNTVNLYAYDAAGNKGTASIVINYAPAPETPATPQKIELKIQDGADVALEKTYNNTTISVSSVSIGKGSIVGLRFSNVSIPKKATITKATLKSYAYAWNKNKISVQYQADASANVDSFKEEKFNISSRLTTNAKVSEAPDEWTKNTYNNSTDLASVIQEVVNNSSWKTGNSLAIIIKDNSSQSYRSIYGFDKKANKAPILEIEYK